MVACGQDLTGTSSTSARDALYFNDRASGLPPVYLQEPYSAPIEVAGGAGRARNWPARWTRNCGAMAR